MSNRAITTSPRALALPGALSALLALLTLTPRVASSGILASSFLVAAGFLAAWTAATAFRSIREGWTPELSVQLRPQHYIQACCQVAVLAYWGWYWRPVYHMAVLFAGQIAFAYAFSILLAWSRGRRYDLGFGPVPIILSINLFLWFRDDWFYLQFLMIGVGFLGKEFVRWNRDGRRVHIFNPSAFALGLFSLVLIATGTTGLTWGQEIATTLTLAPHIYLFLFLVGLVVMHFFSITLIAGTAAAVLFGLSALWHASTGVPYFVDSEIPAAVFLGLHLLVTDPSTSPRTPLGKAIFGGLYGGGVFALYSILGWAGAPTFYDKLLCVPLLNLSVRGIDHFVRTQAARQHGLGRALALAGVGPDGRAPGASPLLPGGPANALQMGLWIVFFGVMAASGRADGLHTGDRLPFWETACAEGRANACDRLLSIEASYCGDASAWACNELGIHYTEGVVVESDPDLGSRYFARACELRFQPGCLNLLGEATPVRDDPRPLDLRLLLREGGRNLLDTPEPELYQRACRHGWGFACSRQARAG